MVEVIPLKYGVTFKRVFKQPDVFCQFAHDVLGITINVDSVHTEYEYPEPIGFVQTRYDLFAEDPEQRIIVEIQHVKEEDFFNRFLYYHLISLAEQACAERSECIRSYAEYDFERTVYTIVVLTSVPRNQSVQFSYAVSDMNPIDERGQTVQVYPHRLVFLNPRLVNGQTPARLREWLDLIADSLDGEVDETRYSSPLFQKIIQDMERDTITPEELSEIKDEAAWEKAQERAASEGRAEGREEGRKMREKEIATAMLERGAEVAFIVEVTGLTPAEIEQLR